MERAPRLQQLVSGMLLRFLYLLATIRRSKVSSGGGPGWEIHSTVPGVQGLIFLYLLRSLFKTMFSSSISGFWGDGKPEGHFPFRFFLSDVSPCVSRLLPLFFDSFASDLTTGISP